MDLRFPAIALLALSTASTVWAGKPAQTLEMIAEGEIQIGTDGKVSDYRLKSELAPLVADLVGRNVRKWRFEPILASRSSRRHGCISRSMPN